MLQTSDAATLRAMLHGWRAAGERVALVPTMGNIHEGHLRLVDAARAQAARVVVSVFVNPTQFDRPDDFDRYPRTLDADAKALAGRGADLLFTPDVETLYPHGLDLAAYVEPTHSAQPLEGEFRPGHFRGMATVVTKLLNLVQPDCAVFGEKDYQQLAIIRRMVRDLDFAIEIVGVPIVRESDGLAMSSRNAYLSAADRKAALSLSAGLAAAEAAYKAGERDAARLVAAARAPIEAESLTRIDYVELRDAEELSAVDGDVSRKAVLAMAVFVGSENKKTRLIDNRVIG